MDKFSIASKLPFLAVEIKMLNGKKVPLGSRDGWHEWDFDKCVEYYNSQRSPYINKKGKKVFFEDKQIIIIPGYNYMIIDTDEEGPNKLLNTMLYDLGLYENKAITQSFRGKLFKNDNKKHYWFRIEDETIKDIVKGPQQYGGWDLIYGNANIFENMDSRLDNIPTLSLDNFNIIFDKMKSEYPGEIDYEETKEETKEETELDEPVNSPELIEIYSEDKTKKKNKKTSEMNSKVDIETVRTILNNLDNKRWDSYRDWISIAMVFINEEYPLEVFDEYSKKSLKYNKEQNEYVIKGLKKTEGFKIATLYHYLKEDNYEVFKKLMPKRDDFWDLVRRLNAKSLAGFFFNHYQYDYYYSVKSGWYETQYNNIIVDTGTYPPSLLNKISNFFQSYFDEQKEILDFSDKEFKDKILLLDKAYIKLGTANFTESIIKYLTELYRNDEIDELLDINTKLLCFSDKVYDISIKRFRDIRPNDYITKTTKNKAPDFNKVSDKDLEEARKILISIFGREDIVDYWIDTTALSFFNANLQNLYVHTGTGGNGKGVLSLLVSELLGDYFRPMDNAFLSTDFESGKPNPSVFGLRGSRYVLVSEPEDNKKTKLKTDFIKSITGGDKIQCRTLYMKKTMEFSPTFTVNLLCNYKPELTRVDNGVKRRVKVIDYPFNFVEKSKVNEALGFKEIDYTLSDKLKTDKYKNAFYKMLIKSAEKNYDKLTDLKTPESVLEDTKDYMEDNNILKGWLEREDIAKRITNKPEDRVLCSKLYEEYIADNPKISRSEFTNLMTNTNGFKVLKSNGLRYYLGFNNEVIVNKPSDILDN